MVFGIVLPFCVLANINQTFAKLYMGFLALIMALFCGILKVIGGRDKQYDGYTYCFLVYQGTKLARLEFVEIPDQFWAVYEVFPLSDAPQVHDVLFSEQLWNDCKINVMYESGVINDRIISAAGKPPAMVNGRLLISLRET